MRAEAPLHLSLLVKCQLLLSNFNQNWNVATNLNVKKM